MVVVVLSLACLSTVRLLLVRTFVPKICCALNESLKNVKKSDNHFFFKNALSELFWIFYHCTNVKSALKEFALIGA